MSAPENRSEQRPGQGGPQSDESIRMQRVEQAVQAASLAFTFLNASHEAIFMLHKNRIVECNDPSIKLFTCPRQEMIGSTHGDLSPEYQPDGRLSAPAGQEYVDRALQGEPQEFDWTYHNMEGDPVPCEVSFNPLSLDLEPHIMAVVRDKRRLPGAYEQPEQETEELRRRNEKLDEFKAIIIESRNKLKGIFDTLEEPILSVTRDSRVESLNLAACQLSGQHPRELVGRHIDEYLKSCNMDQELNDAVRQGFKAMLAQGNKQWFQVEVPGSDYNSYYEINLTPVHDDGGQFLLGIVHIKDVTTFKRMERTIRQHSQELEAKVQERTAELSKVNEELRLLDQLRRDLTGMVVHDMKGPLAEVIGNLDLVLRKKQDPAEMELLQMAMVGADDLLRMITNLLDIGRMEENLLPIKLRAIDFEKLTKTMIDRFATMVRLKGLEVNVVDHGYDEFKADPDLVERVLQNLFTNALNHTEQGSIDVEIRRGGPGEGGVVMSVKDTGCGIPAEHHTAIFKKFTQAGQTAIRTSTGLGLTFCHMATKAMGGKIWLDSALDEGSTFYIWLPGK